MEQEQLGRSVNSLEESLLGIDNNPVYMHAAKKRIIKVDPIDTSNIESVPDANSSKGSFL